MLKFQMVTFTEFENSGPSITSANNKYKKEESRTMTKFSINP